MEKEPEVAVCFCSIFGVPHEGRESIASQEARLAEVAEHKGLKPEIFVEWGCPANGAERLGLRELIKEIQTGRIRMVLVTDLGKLTRRVTDMIDLLDLFEKHGVVLVSLAESVDTAVSDGNMLLKIMVIVARLQEEVMHEGSNE